MAEAGCSFIQTSTIWETSDGMAIFGSHSACQ